MGDLFEIYCLVVLERSCNFNYVKLFIKKTHMYKSICNFIEIFIYMYI